MGEIDFSFVLEHCATNWIKKWKRLFLTNGGGLHVVNVGKPARSFFALFTKLSMRYILVCKYLKGQHCTVSG